MRAWSFIVKGGLHLEEEKHVSEYGVRGTQYENLPELGTKHFTLLL